MLLYVVLELAGPLSIPKSIPPAPEKSNDEVSRFSCLGNKKTREHVFPLSELGMSKLNKLETDLETVPLYWVPKALSGCFESTGTIR